MNQVDNLRLGLVRLCVGSSANMSTIDSNLWSIVSISSKSILNTMNCKGKLQLRSIEFHTPIEI
jgi:hypothetical protein